MKTQEKKQKQVQPKKIEESLSYTVEVRDKEGRVLQRVSAPSRSYVQQWNQSIYAFAKETRTPGPHTTVKDTSGVVHTDVHGDTFTLNANALIGQILFGFRVGKGTTAVAITDYALESPCGEGTGTDEFNHQVVEFTVPSVVGSTCSFTVRRTMINNSGATISGIKEIGCYVKGRANTTVLYIMGFRDVLPSPVYVPHGGSITVIYTIKVTV